MTPKIRAIYDRMMSCPKTWDPVRGGRLLARFVDRREVILPNAHAFDKLADLMIGGRYYPPELIQFYGAYEDEGRGWRVGDRVLQRMTFGPLKTWTMTEVWLAERTKDECRIGYVTTRCHHGRGIWSATLTRLNDGMRLVIQATSGPQSFWFWLGLPVARWIQMYTWKAAIRRFQAMAAIENG